MRRYLMDEGHGITRKSLEYWDAYKGIIGRVVRVDVSEEPLHTEQDHFRGAIFEYNFVAFGTKGTIYLSGCNCGYGGEGPNGTAKILAELGLPIDEARRAMYQKHICYSDGRLLERPKIVACLWGKRGSGHSYPHVDLPESMRE